MIGFLNVSTRKVGGIRFIKIGRLTLSVSVSARYRPIGRQPVRRVVRDMSGVRLTYLEYSR